MLGANGTCLVISGNADDFFPSVAPSFIYGFIDGSQDEDGWPLNGYAWCFAHKRNPTGTSGFQFYIAVDGRMYQRTKNGGVWRPWQKIAFAS